MQAAGAPSALGPSAHSPAQHTHSAPGWRLQAAPLGAAQRRASHQRRFQPARVSAGGRRERRAQPKRTLPSAAARTEHPAGTSRRRCWALRGGSRVSWASSSLRATMRAADAPGALCPSARCPAQRMLHAPPGGARRRCWAQRGGSRANEPSSGLRAAARTAGARGALSPSAHCPAQQPSSAPPPAAPGSSDASASASSRVAGLTHVGRARCAAPGSPRARAAARLRAGPAPARAASPPRRRGAPRGPCADRPGA
jgi:hypothetical protein